MRKIHVDMDALLSAFEYASPEVTYYLDMDSGAVVGVDDETLWELEALQAEFLDPEAEHEFDLPALLKQRRLPEWRAQSLLLAAQIEGLYATRYVDIPKNSTQNGYADMQSFIQTIEHKRLRQRLWESIGGKGAFRRFKGVLRSNPEQRKLWFAFSAKRARKRVLSWLATEGLGVDFSAPESPPKDEVSSRQRARLISEVLVFTRAASALPGITRVALIGSLTTTKPDPKDADVLVTVSDDADLSPLAALARKFQGHAQSFNRSSDVFLMNPQGDYLGRICPWKQCAAGLHENCDALHCGQRPYLHDDLRVLRLPTALVAMPPLELWPEIVVRCEVPGDVEMGVLAPLRVG